MAVTSGSDGAAGLFHGGTWRVSSRFFTSACRVRLLLYRREICWAHIHLVHLVLFACFFYERCGLFPILWKGWVGMKRVPILFRFFPAGVRHDVDESVGPGWIVIRYPVADNIEIVLGL